MSKKQKQFLTLVILISVVAGFIAGGLSGYFLSKQFLADKDSVSDVSGAQKIQVLTQEEAITKVVEEAGPAVVSIIVTKDLPVIEQYWEEYDPFEEFREFFDSPFEDFFSPFKYRRPGYRQKGTEKREVGGGTGFIVLEDGLILTNEHVVLDEEAEYTILTNDGQKYSAIVLARDPVQDLAVLKIEKKGLPTLVLGDSDKLKVGQTVIAIGNALAEFRNTVSVGIISGLKRSITATGGGQSEFLEGVIQTDAAINPGNSGGPLLNLAGQVIGINVAIAQGAENIGFAIPINNAKRDITSVKATGKISYPFLGVRHILITPAIAEKNNLPVDWGALITRGEKPDELAVILGSPAEKAGLVENDIILEVDGQKINQENSLAKIIQQKTVGQKVTLKVLHKGEEKVAMVILGERE